MTPRLATSSRSARWALAASVLLVAATVAAGLWGFSYDDAFITYRYAQNLADGRGLVFNPGEPVLGTTAPGWAVTLGLAAAIGGGVAAWGTLLSSLALAVAAGLLPLAVLRRAPPPWRLAFPALLTAVAFTAPWHLQILGAETFAVLAAGLSAAWLCLAPTEGDADVATPWLARPGRDLAAGLLMAWAMFLRLDAAAAALAVGLVVWAYRRRIPWLYGVAGLLPILPWLAWLQDRFGGVLPITLAAKRNRTVAGGDAAAGVGRVWDYSVAQWRWLLRDLPPWAGAWLLLLAAVGLVALVFWSRRPNGSGRAGAGPRPWLPFLAAVGSYLAAESQPGDVVAAMEIGVLAYVADRPILDLVGLVDPQVEAARRDGRLAELVAERQPRYILTAPHFGRTILGSVLADPGVGRHYRPVARFQSPSYLGGPATLLQRGEP